jgi:hypothetical protein
LAAKTKDVFIVTVIFSDGAGSYEEGITCFLAGNLNVCDNTSVGQLSRMAY